MQLRLKRWQVRIDKAEAEFIIKILTYFVTGEANKLANQANKLAVEGLAEQVKTSGQIHKILV